MLASTIGFAAAATFPAPFDSGSAIVYGANGNVQVDMAAAVNIQTAIGQVSGDDTGEFVIGGDSWMVGTSSDDLEMGESIFNVTPYIDKGDLDILADGTMENEKGTAKYEQFLYFDDITSSEVVYQEDDDENIGLFYKISSGEVIARYVMRFTSNLESDETSSTIEDIDEKEITILGKTYTIITAVNSTGDGASASNIDLTLMSGANKIIIANGEELTVAGHTISVQVTSSTQAQFTVDGETTDKLNAGETYKMLDGTYLGVSEITYQNFAGGLMQATAYVGADKLFLDDGSSLQVNAETISNAAVTVTDSWSGGDFSISEITINMTAEDDLLIPVNGKLSDVADLDEPEVLFTQNWDILFGGLEDAEYETLEVTKSTDSRMELKFENYNGDEITLPLFYSNGSGVFGGEKNGERLRLQNGNSSTAIRKNDYFILNTADPAAFGNNARSYVVQYKGADKVTDSSPKVKFNIIGVENDKQVTLATAGTSTLQLGGGTFTFANATAGTADDFPIYLTSAVGNYSVGATNLSTDYLANFIRTKNNALITIADLNVTTAHGTQGDYAAWIVNVTIDDTNRDGDDFTAAAGQVIFSVSSANNSDNEITATYSGGNFTDWVADNDDNTKSSYVTVYGNDIEYSNPSGSPATVKVMIPDSIVTPKVYVSSGEVTVSGGTTAAGGLAPIVADSAIGTVQGSNLVVVGGSCINSVAAKLLGSDSPLCGAEFTAATQVGAGKYIIDTFASPYTSGKVAMLVAGYEAADTTAAAQKVVDDSLSPDAAAAAVIGPVTA